MTDLVQKIADDIDRIYQEHAALRIGEETLRAGVEHVIRQALARQPQERSEAVAWIRTRLSNGERDFDEEGPSSRHANLFSYEPLYAHPPADDARVAELEAEVKRLREEVHAHSGNEVDFAEQNAALESQLAEYRAARIAYANEFPPNADGGADVGNIHANIRHLKQQLTASREREGRMRELLLAVESSEFEGDYCNDVNGVSWFDARDAALAAEKGEKE